MATRTVPRHILERADANFVAHVTYALDRTAGMTTCVSPQLVIADSGLACDTFNFVCRARLDAAGAHTAAMGALAWFVHARRPFSWWVGPADRPAALGAVLESIGLTRAETELAMALTLDDLPPAPPAPAGLEVVRVRTPAELAEFAAVLAANWSPPDANVVTFYERAAGALLAPDSPQRYYLGRMDGEAVAAAEATVHDGAVGLYNIATREAVRGRGIGTAMTHRPLADALADDCDLGVLQAAPDGVGVYRRLGFVAYGEITEYKPAP